MYLHMTQRVLKAWTRKSVCSRHLAHLNDRPIPSPGTSHLATADHNGLAISVITTINTYFGSHVLVPETGIIMNNEMNGMRIRCV